METYTKFYLNSKGLQWNTNGGGKIEEENVHNKFYNNGFINTSVSV
jgi:hypothetical protein